MNYTLESSDALQEPVSVEDVGFLRQYIQTLQRKCKQLERQQEMSSHIVADLTSALEEQRVMELLQQRELYAYRTYSEFRDAAVQLHLNYRRKVQRASSPATPSRAKSLGTGGEVAAGAASGGASSLNEEKADRAAMINAAVLKDFQQREKKLKAQVATLTVEVDRLGVFQQQRAQEKEAEASSETVRMLTEQIQRRDGMIRSLMEKNSTLSSKVAQTPISAPARNELAAASRSTLDDREKLALQEFRNFLPSASSSPYEDPRTNQHSASPVPHQHPPHVATALASRGVAPFTLQVTGSPVLGHAGSVPLTKYSSQPYPHVTSTKESQPDGGRRTAPPASFGRPKMEIITREDPLRAHRRATHELSLNGLNLDG